MYFSDLFLEENYLGKAPSVKILRALNLKTNISWGANRKIRQKVGDEGTAMKRQLRLLFLRQIEIKNPQP